MIEPFNALLHRTSRWTSTYSALSCTTTNQHRTSANVVHALQSSKPVFGMHNILPSFPQLPANGFAC